MGDMNSNSMITFYQFQQLPLEIHILSQITTNSETNWHIYLMKYLKRPNYNLIFCHFYLLDEEINAEIAFSIETVKVMTMLWFHLLLKTFSFQTEKLNPNFLIWKCIFSLSQKNWLISHSQRESQLKLDILIVQWFVFKWINASSWRASECR